LPKRENMDLKVEITDAVKDFLCVCALAKTESSAADFEIDYQPAPHKPKGLPKGKLAIYIFAYDSEMLKIGRAGVKSKSRFTYQHYKFKKEGSNLTKSILTDNNFPVDIEESNVGEWIKTNCDRLNVFINENKGLNLLKLLEAFLHQRYFPRYEG